MLSIKSVAGDEMTIDAKTIVGWGTNIATNKSFVIWAGGVQTVVTEEPYAKLLKRILAARKPAPKKRK